MHSAPLLPSSTSPGSRCKLQPLLLYLHVICSCPRSSAALSAIALCRLSHYLPPCEVSAHLCTLVFKGRKKGKGRDFALLSEALSPCNVHFTQQSKCYQLTVKMEPCIENMCILTWHINGIIFQGLYRHAEGFRKWIFEKLLTTNLYCLQIE